MHFLSLHTVFSCCLSVCLSDCLSVLICLSVCLSMYPELRLAVAEEALDRLGQSPERYNTLGTSYR